MQLLFWFVTGLATSRPVHIKMHPKDHDMPIPDWEYYSIVVTIIFLVLLGGLVAGLTIGLMSIDSTNLAILKSSGTPSEKIYAARIEPIRKNGHLLLVTLLLVNTIVNESLPILFDLLHFTGIKAVLFSTGLIVLFGEILPQAVCTKYGLQIGAFLALPVRFLIAVMYVIAYPISALLDWLLGHKEGNIYSSAGLKELVALHGEDKEGPLSKDEVSILRAVLDLRHKTVGDIMTSLENVFMLSIDGKLDRATIQRIVKAGHSRIPIHLGDDRHQVLGTLLVKQLILNDPDDETPLTALKLRKVLKVRCDTPLYDMLHLFESGSSHMALVVDDIETPVFSTKEVGGTFDHIENHMATISPRWNPFPEERPYTTLGILTLEDLIEELIGEEIIDETDVYVNMATKTRVQSRSRRHNSPFKSKRYASTLGVPELDLDGDSCTENEEERKPLLAHSSPIEGSSQGPSAISTQLFNLPQAMLDHKRKPSDKSKREKKVFFDAVDLASDLQEEIRSSVNSTPTMKPTLNVKSHTGLREGSSQ
ncbi:hypothetical protein BC833DRAFT_602133 [Globomyces pollinis-pini]|nr:hypothetical protein BC833DRAFT_602133 [Globomyces pollinis-pini]